MFKSKLLVTVTAIALTVGISPHISNAIAETIPARVAQNNDGSTVVEKLNEEAIGLFRAGQPRAALAKVQSALKIAQTNRDRYGMAICFNNLGLIYVGTGEYQKAIAAYQKSLPLSREINNKNEEGVTLNGLGDVYGKIGKYAQANEYFQQALVLVRQIGERTGEASILANLATNYSNLADYQKAIEYYQKSTIVAREIGSRSLVGVNLNGLGAAYLNLGQYQKAISYFQQSLTIRQEIGNRLGESIVFNNLGYVYSSLGEYQKAIDYYQKALTIKTEIDDRNGRATTLLNIGAAYAEKDRHQKAIEYFQQALKIQVEIGDRSGEGTTLNNLGTSSQSLARYPQAIAYFQKALKIQIEIRDRQKESTTLNNIGNIYEDLRQYPTALDFYQKSLIVKKAIGDREGQAISLNNKGSVFYKLKKFPQAEAELRQSIAIWESLRAGLTDSNKISFGERIAITYRLLQKVLIQQGRASAALEISERARARSLAELLASKVNTISSAAQSKLRQAPNLSKIQQIAKQKSSTLVQYSLIDESIYIWVVQPNGKIAFKESKLPPNTKIKDLVYATRYGIGAKQESDPPPTVKSDLKQLHQLLIAPIASELPKDPNATVTIIPQDDLLIVPFAALEDSQGKYFIEQHTINIAPSIQVLGLATPNRTQSGKTLVVGNPIMPISPFDGKRLDSLLGAEEEARSIGTIINTQPLIGAAADKQQVVKRMQSANLIHLATHGFFVKVEGDLPGAVALTGGYLTSDEVFDMQLQADLVVLSACDTGRGNITGDGVVGLSRSLVVAGVPSVMVSLWEVDDKATKVLMEEFYQQFWVKKLPKAQAIRQAMLKTKHQFEDPNLWGAFMLVGDAK